MAGNLYCPKARPPNVFSLKKSMPLSVLLLILASTLAVWFSIPTSFSLLHTPSAVQNVPINAQEILAQCMSLRATPGPPLAFHSREISDRYEPGTNATLIKNAMIWTGEKNGSVIFHGNVFLDQGVVKSLGKIPQYLLNRPDTTTVIDAKGAWVTPGLGEIDLHFLQGYLLSTDFPPI